MHILFDVKKEMDLLRELSHRFPVGSTLVSQNSKGRPLKRYVVVQGEGMVQEEDFVENNRKFKKGEREKFEKGITKQDVAEYFVNGEEGKSVYREYEVCSNLEYGFFKHVRHAGKYVVYKGSKQRNLFHISVGKKDKIEDVESELKFILDLQRKRHPNWNPIEFGIFEHTLSEGGVYTLYISKDNSSKIEKCTYGHTETLKTFSKLYRALDYIQMNHWYGDEEE